MNVAVRILRENYFVGDKVDFEIVNQSNKSIFVFPSLFDEVSLRGNVLNGTEELVTFDYSASLINNKERSPIDSVEIKSGKNFSGSWSGKAFLKTGNDRFKDWKSFQPDGKFKIKIIYSLNKKDKASFYSVSEEFSVSKKSFFRKIFK